MWNRRLTLIALVLLVSGSGVAPAAEEQIKLTGRQFFALTVPNAVESAAWYQRAFGVRQIHEIKPPDGSAHVLILGNEALTIELLQLRDATSPGEEVIRNRHKQHGIFKVGTYVADLEGAVRHLRAMGAQFETGIVNDAATGLRFVLVLDNNGNTFQLFEGGGTGKG